MKDRIGKDIEAFLADLGEGRGNGVGAVGTRQCHHHHDLHPRAKQARALGKKSGGYLEERKDNDIVQVSGAPSPGLPGIRLYQKKVGASRYLNQFKQRKGDGAWGIAQKYLHACPK